MPRHVSCRRGQRSSVKWLGRSSVADGVAYLAILTTVYVLFNHKDHKQLLAGQRQQQLAGTPGRPYPAIEDKTQSSKHWSQ